MSGNCPHRVIEIYTGPRGNIGPIGPAGSSGGGIFTYRSGSTWFTTSSIEITGSLTISGSNTFKNIGPAIFSGSVDISGSTQITGSLLVTGSIVGNFTGSLLGTASYSNNALTASYLSGSVSVFPYTGSAAITGSLTITGPTTTTGQATFNTFVQVGNTLFANLASTSWIIQNTGTAGNVLIQSRQSGGTMNNFMFHNNGFFGINQLSPSMSLDVSGSGRFVGNLEVTGSIKALVTGSDFINLGNASSASQRLVRIGQDTSTIDIGSSPTNGGLGAIYINQATPSGTNFSLMADAGNLWLNAVSSVGAINFRVGGNNIVTVTTNNTKLTGSLEVTGSIKAFVTGSDFVNIGNATTSSQRLVRIGQDTSWVDIGSTVGSTTQGAIYINTATPSGTNFSLQAFASNTVLNGATACYISVGASIKTTTTTTTTLFEQGPSSNTDLTPFVFRPPVASNMLSGSNIPNFVISGSSKQWATGNINNQYWNYFKANTVDFTGASTATNVYGLYVEASTVGANATITNNWALGTSGSVSIGVGTDGIKFQGLVGTLTDPTIYLNVATPSSTNHAITWNSTGNLLLNCLSSQTIKLGVNGSYYWSFGLTMAFSPPVVGGNTTTFLFNQPANVGATNLSEVNGFKMVGSSRAWGAGIGIIPIQRENYWSATTYTQATNALTITNAYGNYFEAPIASTNVIITNNYAAGFAGAIQVNSSSYNSTSSIINSGSTNFYYQTTQSFNSSFFEYYIMSGSNARAGNIMSLWSGSSIVYTETTTNDIGLTNNFTMSVYISGSSAVLKTDTNTNGWTLKAIIRSI